MNEAIIEFTGGLQATLNLETGWACQDANIQLFLNTLYGFDQLQSYSLNPVADLVTKVAKEWKIKIISTPETESEPGVIY